MTAKTVTLKLPPRVFRKAAAMAARREVSLDQLFQEGLAQLERDDDHARLYDEFSLLGGDAEGSDVRFAHAAQAEVVRRHEDA